MASENHSKKLQALKNKRNRAEKELYKLVSSIPEVVALQNKINKIDNKIQETIWTEAFSTLKTTFQI